jgi:hypothetical protein
MISAIKALGSVVAPPPHLIGSGSIVADPAVAIAIAIAALLSSAGSRCHTSAILFTTIFCFLIVDS